MRTRFVCGAAALALLSGVASAGLIYETEPNSTLAQANPLPIFTVPGGSIAVDGEITAGVPNDEPDDAIPGDVDWFVLDLTSGDAFLALSVFVTNPPNANAGGGGGGPDRDPALQILNSDFVVVAHNDDSFGLNPAWGGFLGAGTYYIGISTFQDLDFPDAARGGPSGTPTVFDGFDAGNQGRPSTDFFTYKLTIGVNIVPTPGAASLAAVAGLLALRRRRD